jgi:hypothetical protein
MWVVLLTAKNNAPDAIKRVQAEEAQSGRKRTMAVSSPQQYCADEGIQRHVSAPYAPQQNGVVDRRNQAVVARARALLKHRSMSAEFWGDTVSTAVLLNRAPTKSLTRKTPYEAWHGRKTAVHYLRTFGYLAYVKEQGDLHKLDDRSSLTVFIGYKDGVKAYRLLDLLGHVPPHGGVLAAQHQPKKSNTYQPLIEVRIQRLRYLLERYKGENPSHLGG